MFTAVATGCIRVQKGDFTAYIPPEIVEGLGQFFEDHWYDTVCALAEGQR